MRKGANVLKASLLKNRQGGQLASVHCLKKTKRYCMKVGRYSFKSSCFCFGTWWSAREFARVGTEFLVRCGGGFSDTSDNVEFYLSPSLPKSSAD